MPVSLDAYRARAADAAKFPANVWTRKYREDVLALVDIVERYRSGRGESDHDQGEDADGPHSGVSSAADSGD